MQTVFSNSMVAHVWAQGNQDHGRSNNGQFYFDGPTLYSYGTHFVVAYRMPDGQALMNADSYSITTSRHQSEARRAVNYTYLEVPDLTALVHTGALYRLDDMTAREHVRAAIVRFVGERALSFPDDSALYLLGQVNRARSWPRLKREAERKRKRERELDRKAEIRARKADAEAMAGLTDSAFAELVTQREGERPWGRYPTGRDWPRRTYRHATPSEALAAFATELHRLKAAAKAHCGKRALAALQARHKAVRARVAQLAAWEAHGEALAAYGRNLADLRTLWRERMESGPLSRQRNRQLGALANAVAAARPGLLTAHAREQLRLVADNAAALETQAAERESRERMEREREQRERWLAGEGSRHVRLSDAQGGALLRAAHVERDDSGMIVNGTLETSHGADVPLTHALKAFAFVKRVRETGTPWQANGHTIRVGHFRVDSIDSAGTMRAGCHTIHWAEMVRLAMRLGVADMADSDSALEPSGRAA